MNSTRHSDHGPFASSPSVERYVPLEQFETIIGQSIDAIDRQAGPLAILGGPGMGKTMLCLQLAERLRGRYEVVLLSSSQLISRGDLLRTLMYELQLPYRGMMDGELRLNLIERLQHPRHGGGDRLALVVDEAQALSPRILEELRLLTNLQVHGRPCVSLVLCGSLRLEELLNHPQLDSLNQRLAARHVMQPLTAAAAGEYLHAKMQRCEEGSRIAFDRAAADALHLVSGGVPRLLDQTARRTMQLVAAASSDSMTAVAVERAWHQLQQPLPPFVGESPIGQDAHAQTQDAESHEAGLHEAGLHEAGLHEAESLKAHLHENQAAAAARSATKGAEPGWTGYRDAGESYLARQNSEQTTPAPQGGWLGEVARSLEAQNAASKGSGGRPSSSNPAVAPATVGVPPSAGKGLSSAISLPASHQNPPRQPRAEAVTDAAAMIVELDQAVVGYGSQPLRDAWATASTAAESLVSEDEVVSPASQMNAVSLSAIEDELWQMVANINIESSAIDSLSAFESIEAGGIEIDVDPMPMTREVDFTAAYVEAWTPAPLHADYETRDDESTLESDAASFYSLADRPSGLFSPANYDASAEMTAEAVQFADEVECFEATDGYEDVDGYADADGYAANELGEAANAELSEVGEHELHDVEDEFEGRMDRSAGFQAFAPQGGSPSIFRDAGDRRDDHDYSPAEPIAASTREVAPPRVDDLDSIAAAAGEQSRLFSLADWDATPIQPSVPHDDRDILVIDSGEESRGTPAPSRSTAAGFVPQSYTQLFESLRR